MNKEEKQKEAEALREQLAKARGIILAGFQGLRVPEDTNLRRKVAQAGARYKVVKNTLAERAAQGTPAESVTRALKGTTSVAYTESDPVALARILTSYAKENPALVFKAGIVEGRVVSLAELGRIATLPSLDVLRSKILFLIKSPAQSLASAASALARNVAVLVQQAGKEKKFKEAGSPGQE